MVNILYNEGRGCNRKWYQKGETLKGEGGHQEG